MKNSEATKEAQRLVSQASGLVLQAREKEETSYEGALQLYESALETMEVVTSKHRKTKVAQNVKTGNVKIGGHTLAALTNSVIPRTRVKASAESDPLLCAWYVAESFKEAHVRDWGLRRIAEEYCRMEDYDSAFKTCDAIADEFPQGRVLVMIAASEFKRGDVKSALKTLSRALRFAEKMSGDWTRADVLTRIAGQYLTMGEQRRCGKVLSKAIRVARKGPSILCAASMIDVAHMYEELGKTKQAERILLEALKAIRTTMIDPKWRAGMLGRVATECAARGEHERALQLASTINCRQSRASALLAIGGEYLQSGDKDRGCEVVSRAVKAVTAESVEEKEDFTFPIVQARVLAVASKMYFDAEVRGRPEVTLRMALKRAEEIPESHLRPLPLLAVAEGYAAIGKQHEATSILTKVLKEAAEQEPARVKVSILSDIAALCVRLGQRDRLLEILSEARAVAEEEELSPFRAFELGEIGQKYLDARRVRESFLTARSIRDSLHRPVIYLQIACTYADASRPVDEKAKQILHEIILDIERDEGLEGSEPDDESAQIAIIAIYPSCMMREPDP